MSTAAKVKPSRRYASRSTALAWSEQDAALTNPLTIDSFLLAGQQVRAKVTDAITSVDIEMTIEGASTLTINILDASRELTQSGLFSSAVRLSGIAGMHWQLVNASRQGDSVSLVFEPYIVSLLRQQTKPKKVARSKMTRAEFIRSLVLEIKNPEIEFICPELHTTQQIQNSRQKESTVDRDSRRDKGLPSDTKSLKIKGTKADKSQLSNLDRVLVVADRLDAPTKATLALIVACIQESVCRNLSGGDRDSRGILQVRDQTARSLRIDNRDIEECAHTFLTRGFYGKGGAIKIARNNSGYSVGEIAQAVQGSAYPNAYQPHLPEAKKILSAFGSSTSRTKSKQETSKYEFSRGKPGGKKNEDSWTCSGRLAEEVGWRRFLVSNRFYYISDEDLLQSRPRMTVIEGKKGINDIDYNVDAGKDVDEASFTCRADLWVAPPGSVINIEETGIIDGRWLVTSLRRGVYDVDTTIEIKRGTSLLRDKKEPAAESTSSSKSDSRTSGRGGSSSSMIRPVSGGKTTSGFGRRIAPTKGASSYHDGIDIGVPVGTNVKAVLDGTVQVSTSSNGGYGGYVELRHKDGLVTFYGHLSKELVRKGQRVKQGDVIAKSGNSGTSTGAHLHFGVHKNGKPVDPENYL